jgi:hypothetical protein
VKAARSACKNPLESLSLQQEPSSGGTKTSKRMKEGQVLDSPREIKLRRVDAELFGEELSRT